MHCPNRFRGSIWQTGFRKTRYSAPARGGEGGGRHGENDRGPRACKRSTKNVSPRTGQTIQAAKVVRGGGGDGPDYRWGNDGQVSFVDKNNSVWVGDNIEPGGHIYKSPGDGKSVMRLGSPGPPGGWNDIEHFNRPADMAVDR